MDDYDYDISDEPCPRCGAHEVCFRECDQIGCDDGYIDEHDDDPINFAPGEEYTMCNECLGTGTLTWCKKCGLDINRHNHLKSQQQ